MVQYYTLEQAAQILRVSPDQLKEMARKKEVRAFQDRSGWRFRAQEIDEMARSRGLGSDPELPLSDGGKGKTGETGSQDVFNFSLDVDEGDEVALGKQPSGGSKAPSPSGSGSRTTKSPPPKASSDSDVRLVMEGSDLDFSIDAEGSSKAHGSKAPVSPAPKVGSSKSRKAPPAKEDSGVRIVPLDKPSDSDVKIVPSSTREGDVPLGEPPVKRPSDSDIRIEELPRAGARDQMVTEEIDLDAEQRKAEASRAKSPRQRPKPGSSPILPTTSPFELSENDMNVDLPAVKPGARSPEKTKGETDSSSDFELKPLADSSPLELSSDELKAMQSDEEVSLGELTGAKGGSGINLQDPADSGISLEPESSEFELTVDSGTTPKPAPVSDPGTDSSSDFELSLHEDDSSPAEGSSSEFELSLQGDEGLAPGSSSEFELSLDSAASEEEGSSDLALEAPGTDSDSEFELTLDESGGLSLEEGGEEGSSDFEVPALEEEGGEESDTDLESSEFDLSLEGEGEESGSQVVPLEDEEEYDEGAATVQRPAPKLKPKAEAEEDIGEALDEDLDAEPAEEEAEEPAVVTAAAPPAEWGVVVPITSLLCTIVLFVVGLMSFELIQGMWGFHRGTKVSNFLIHPIAKTLSGEDNLPDN